MIALLVLLQVFIMRSMREHQDTVADFLQQRRGRNPVQAFYASRIHRFQKWSLCLCCCLCLLCVRTSVLKAEEATLEKCVEYFEEILETQKMRQIFQRGANELMARFERGEITKIEVDNTLRVWHTVENELKDKVTALYDLTYEKKCFDEKLNESR